MDSLPCFPLLVERGMTAKDAIPSASGLFQEVFIRSQRCPCGGFFSSVKQGAHGSVPAVEIHRAKCSQCGRIRPFCFDTRLIREEAEATTRFDRMEAILEEGLRQLAEGDFLAGEACFREVIALEPWFGVAHYHLGMIALMTERYELAQEALETAVGILPLDAAIHDALSRLWTEIGHEERAARAGWLAMQIEATLDGRASEG
jgi:hypothetical protein